ncbi:uncharacterized protein PHALS_06359 [Plasmopara halstedii]|uniref:Uncharacterized protein n=1 Tax=Plasmopara halstedii TaxID=4781 RepID=A0A0P1B1C3_PLAHL|nr:uncharacterized protein PHALS_06359 [Plasmopara halstedii]CEG48541.1 hypothetical protein PHALS_06359 [Plasmopara halstedii]|eukprot:XP_024584910.1 hypothetical protein PHALS_06359 [Plasmopara halstedii]
MGNDTSPQPTELAKTSRRRVDLHQQCLKSMGGPPSHEEFDRSAVTPSHFGNIAL